MDGNRWGLTKVKRARAQLTEPEQRYTGVSLLGHLTDRTESLEDTRSQVASRSPSAGSPSVTGGEGA
jgi:hypothetical protein